MYIEKCPSFHRYISGHGESTVICDSMLYDPDCENCPIGAQYRNNRNNSKEIIDNIKKIPMRS